MERRGSALLARSRARRKSRKILKDAKHEKEGGTIFGTLYKRNRLLRWKKRKFRFIAETRRLQCCKEDGTPYKSSTLHPDASVDIVASAKSRAKRFVFIVMSGKLRITLAATSSEQRKKWVDAILDTAPVEDGGTAGAERAMTETQTNDDNGGDDFIWLNKCFASLKIMVAPAARLGSRASGPWARGTNLAFLELRRLSDIL